MGYVSFFKGIHQKTKCYSACLFPSSINLLIWISSHLSRLKVTLSFILYLCIYVWVMNYFISFDSKRATTSARTKTLNFAFGKLKIRGCAFWSLGDLKGPLFLLFKWGSWFPRFFSQCLPLIKAKGFQRTLRNVKLGWNQNIWKRGWLSASKT